MYGPTPFPLRRRRLLNSGLSASFARFWAGTKAVIRAFSAQCRLFAMASINRLLLSALLTGLSDAVSRNDDAKADRYRTRIDLIARQHFATNPSISDAVERLLLATDRWLATKVAERVETEQQVSDVIERVSELLRPRE